MEKQQYLIQRALISVSDKTGLLPFVHELVASGIQILATGGTAQFLLQHQYPVIQVSDYTGFPEIMDGRVKTLHPKIFSGLLQRPDIDQLYAQNESIQPIDLLIVNLYPFAETIAKPDCQFDEAIEKIDIGGPAMLRAAAKNHQNLTVIFDPNDYDVVLTEIKQNRNTTLHLRRSLAAKVFAYTAQYDQAIYSYLASFDDKTAFRDQFQLQLQKKQDLRYGENPHQAAAFYTNLKDYPGPLAETKLLQGKPLSYCNLLDSDTALNIVSHLNSDLAACVIVKHASPCGVAEAKDLHSAYQNALASDPISAFGGIIAVNRPLDKETAEVMLGQSLIEVILAPSIPSSVLALFNHKPNWRLLTYPMHSFASNLTMQSVNGGLLIQQVDPIIDDPSSWKVVSTKQPSTQELTDLQFAWRVAAFTKSNAIVIAKNQQTLGIGGGQTSRVFSAEIAILKAREQQHSIHSAVAASDGFFPFADGATTLARAGIRAIIQPGGSKRDQEVIAAADLAGIVMIFTGTRHFRH